jgi:hypothetical protein
LRNGVVAIARQMVTTPSTPARFKVLDANRTRTGHVGILEGVDPGHELPPYIIEGTQQMLNPLVNLAPEVGLEPTTR